MTTYDNDSPDQPLGLTPGEGDDAAGLPNGAASPLSSATPAAQTSGAVPTAKRPIAAKTPTAPQTRQGVSVAKPTTGAAAGNVALKPGQIIADESLQGSYATVRRTVTKASVNPIPSNVTVVAESIPVGTNPPLKNHIETEPAHRTAKQTKKASPTKKRSHHPKSESGHHPRRPKHHPPANAASAGGGGIPNPFTHKLSAFDSSLKVVASGYFETLEFTGETEVEASVSASLVHVHIDVFTGYLTIEVEKRTVLDASFGILGAHELEVVDAVHTAIDKVKKATKITRIVDGQPVTLSASTDGLAAESDRNGIRTKITANWRGQIVISMEGTVNIPSSRVPGSTVPVNLKITTTLTPTPPAGKPAAPGKVGVLEEQPVQQHTEAHKALLGFLDVLALPLSEALKVGNALGNAVGNSHGPAAPPLWLRYWQER